MSTMGDKRMYQLTVAINKALNPMEAPLKIKHARSAIIITHRTRESKSFWVICTRQPLMENRFTAWKFCHLLHKVLREGHESVLKQSLTHRKMIIEMGKLWGHLQDGVGHCIKAYSKLLVTKINFHEKNRIFPGSLIIADFADIERYAQGDINVHFQMCVEIFDYLDDILEVQTTVFTSINSYRMSSMTPQGQCRLAPLITLIQDSNPLYDVCVRLMFRLHDELPNDILSGHRDRFRELFRRLKQFYDNVRPLQYFADLIQVPHLPEMSPNFSSRVDFGSYVPPVVHVPEEPEPEHDPMVNDLVDTSYAQQQEVEESAVPPTAPTNLEVMQLEQNIRERDQRIFELQSDLIATRESVNMLEQQYKQKVSEMREEYVLLSNELATANEQCANLRLERDDLELKLENTTPTLLAKATEGEEKAKQSEEKFNKLKSLYTSIRDEHVQLLRKHGESTKELNREQSAKQELQQRCEESAKEINELKEKCALVQAQTEQMKELEAQRSALEEECSTLRQQFEALAESKGNEVEELTKQLQQLAITSQELTASRAEIDDLKEQLQVTKTNLQETNSEHAEVLLKLQDELKQRLEEIKANREQAEALQEELSAVRSQLQQEQTDKMSTKTEMQLELSNKAIALSERELTIVSLNKQISELQTNLEMQAETSETTLNTMQETLGKTTSELSLATQTLEEKNAMLQQTTEELIASQQALEVETAKLAEESRAKLELQQTVEELTVAKNELSACLERSNAAAQATKESLELELKNYQHRFDQMRLAVAQQACFFYAERAEDNNNQGYRQAQQTALQLEQSLLALHEAYRTYRQGDGLRFDEVQRLSISVIALTQQLCMLYEQGNFIAHTAADIEKSELLSQRLHELCKLLEHLHQSLQQTESAGLESAINSQFQELSKLNTEVSILLSSLLQSLNKQTDLGDMVQNELNEMDAAIEEAVSRFVDLLSATRQQDAGVQLEVNEKILDACTGLMECIKQLIKKSKLLQDEIVSAGRGKSSVKDFYKRNSQWTEGLISASKSVARGANLLVDAANKAVESPETSEHFQIIVAAQEIAACTAQLVIASKVKAPQNSAKLGELTIASRNVSKATGAVVATVKSCSQDLEQAQEIDVTKLTASQLKAMEMEIHVKVLQLEQALEMERRRLSAFRRQNYQNNEE